MFVQIIESEYGCHAQWTNSSSGNPPTEKLHIIIIFAFY